MRPSSLSPEKVAGEPAMPCERVAEIDLNDVDDVTHCVDHCPKRSPERSTRRAQQAVLRG